MPFLAMKYTFACTNYVDVIIAVRYLYIISSITVAKEIVSWLCDYCVIVAVGIGWVLLRMECKMRL